MYETLYYYTTGQEIDPSIVFAPDKSVALHFDTLSLTYPALLKDEFLIEATINSCGAELSIESCKLGLGPIPYADVTELSDGQLLTLAEGSYSFLQLEDSSQQNIQSSLQLFFGNLHAKAAIGSKISNRLYLRGVREVGFYAIQIIAPYPV